jgi:hypothetical protein
MPTSGTQSGSFQKRWAKSSLGGRNNSRPDTDLFCPAQPLTSWAAQHGHDPASGNGRLTRIWRTRPSFRPGPQNRNRHPRPWLANRNDNGMARFRAS